jgi:hypothetical protein
VNDIDGWLEAAYEDRYTIEDYLDDVAEFDDDDYEEDES